jgi:TolB protein
MNSPAVHSGRVIPWFLVGALAIIIAQTVAIVVLALLLMDERDESLTRRERPVMQEPGLAPGLEEYLTPVDGLEDEGGELLLFRSLRDGQSRFWTVQPDGRDAKPITSAGASLEAAWSPDGRFIAMTGAAGDATQTDIYTMRADGSQFRNVTDSPGHDQDPDWSPDGKRIVFITLRTSVNPDIYVMDADGGNQRPLIEADTGEYGPRWSPDGRRIVFHRYIGGSGGSELFVINADGTNERRLTENGVFDGNASWSPDGSLIAFVSFRDGSPEIYTIDTDFGSVKRLTENGVPDYGPSFSPDGKTIVFSSIRQFEPAMYMMDLDGGNQRQVERSGPDAYNPVWRRAPR